MQYVSINCQITHCEDKEVLVTIKKAIAASPELRSKKALIENIIAGINDVDDIMTEWNNYVAVQRDQQLIIIIDRFKKTQIKAAIKVNEEMLRFYWSLGRDIVEMQAESKWGSSFFDTLSEDLRKMFPGTKGFSTTNLRYMKRYYDMFGEILPQLEAELSDITNLPQVGAEIYAIPWGHIKVIVDKCKENPEKALFFVDEVIKNNWSN